MTKQPCVYILASKRNGTLYIGVTSNLIKRVWKHKNDLVPGFTQRYRVQNWCTSSKPQTCSPPSPAKSS